MRSNEANVLNVWLATDTYEQLCSENIKDPPDKLEGAIWDKI